MLALEDWGSASLLRRPTPPAGCKCIRNLAAALVVSGINQLWGGRHHVGGGAGRVFATGDWLASGYRALEARLAVAALEMAFARRWPAGFKPARQVVDLETY